MAHRGCCGSLFAFVFQSWVIFAREFRRRDAKLIGRERQLHLVFPVIIYVFKCSSQFFIEAPRTIWQRGALFLQMLQIKGWTFWQTLVVVLHQAVELFDQQALSYVGVKVKSRAAIQVCGNSVSFRCQHVKLVPQPESTCLSHLSQAVHEFSVPRTNCYNQFTNLSTNQSTNQFTNQFTNLSTLVVQLLPTGCFAMLPGICPGGRPCWRAMACTARGTPWHRRSWQIW